VVRFLFLMNPTERDETKTLEVEDALQTTSSPFCNSDETKIEEPVVVDETMKHLRTAMKKHGGVVYQVSSKSIPLTITCSPNDMSNVTKQFTINRTYSFESINSISKFLVNESCENHISDNLKHISLRDKLIDLEMTTTNDFIAEESTWFRFLLAWIIILIQFICLLAIIHETIQTNVESVMNWEIIIIKIFIMFYMASEIYDITETLEDTSIGSDLLQNYGTENIIYDFLSSLGLIYIFFMSLYTLLIHFNGNSYKSKSETMKLLKSSANLVIYFLSLLTSCFVVQRQETALDCLFNFSGILVVNSFDEIVFKAFNLPKKLYVLSDELNEEERVKKDLIKKSKLKMAFQRMNLSSFVMLVILIGCLLF
jgi:hypothetical protein